MLILTASMLTACAGFSASVKPVLSPPPASLAQACPRPVDLPASGLTRRQVERYWRTDRASLVTCRDRHGQLVSFYRDRDGRLSGGR